MDYPYANSPFPYANSPFLLLDIPRFKWYNVKNNVCVVSYVYKKGSRSKLPPHG